MAIFRIYSVLRGAGCPETCACRSRSLPALDAARIKDHPLLREIAEGRECGWINPDRVPFEEAAESLPLGREGMEDASLRLSRFAPLGMRLFPETKVTGGIIESPSRADSEDAGRTCGKGYFRIWHALSDRGFWYCHCKLRQGKRRNPGGLNAHRRSGT